MSEATPMPGSKWELPGPLGSARVTILGIGIEKRRRLSSPRGTALKLLGCLPGYLKPLIEFLYLSGWRKGEALKLEWRDVDL